MSNDARSESPTRPANGTESEKTSADARAEFRDLRPPDVRTTVLVGILVLMILCAVYFAAEIIVPLVFAILLKLLLQPVFRFLVRWRLPQPVAAAIVLTGFFGVIGMIGYGLAGPASHWLAKAPESLPRLEERLTVLKRPMDHLLTATHRVEQIAEGPAEKGTTAVTVRGPGISEYVFFGTRDLLVGAGITILLLFFLLASGDLFMRKLVEILPTFSDKKQAVEMSHEIERNVSGYLMTISVMNILVGIATALAMWAIGVPDPALWGAAAFLLNYVLILGPLTGLVMFFLVGVLNFTTLWQTLLPPAAYLIIHIIEGETVTPLLVARRFTLNPVLVIGSLVFWDWMWGIPGALLAVPMLAVFKIVCERVRPLMPIGHFIGG